MPKISRGAGFAWQVATFEAAHATSEFIEPEHLFIGVCKLASLAQVDDWSELQLPKNETDTLRVEVKALTELFTHFRINHVELYRQVRQRKGHGNFEHNERETVSRSSACKVVFAAAGLAANPFATTSLHLLYALLEDANSIVGSVLDAKGADLDAVRATALDFSPKLPGTHDSNSTEHVVRIAEMLLRDLENRLEAQHIGLVVEESVLEWLCSTGCDQTYGARHLRRVVEQHIENPIAGKIRREEVRARHIVHVKVKSGALEFIVVGLDTL